MSFFGDISMAWVTAREPSLTMYAFIYSLQSCVALMSFLQFGALVLTGRGLHVHLARLGHMPHPSTYQRVLSVPALDRAECFLVLKVVQHQTPRSASVQPQKQKRTELATFYSSILFLFIVTLFLLHYFGCTCIRREALRGRSDLLPTTYTEITEEYNTDTELLYHSLTCSIIQGPTFL